MKFFRQFFRRKSSISLFLTALSVSWIGLSFGKHPIPFLDAVVLAFITLGLVAVVYSIDVDFDSFPERAAEMSWSAYGALIAFVLFLSQSLAGWMSFWACTGILLLGFFYSMPWLFQKKKRRLKNVLILKNFLVGLGWALLLPLGGSSTDLHFPIFFVFVLIQVFIGSSLRDFDDLDEDRQSGVRSLPVVFGLTKALWILRSLNIVSLILVYFFLDFQWQQILFYGFVIVVIWREGVFQMYKSLNPPRWKARSIYNLLTCAMIAGVRGIEIWFL